jgi:hypothetical protein
MPPATRSSKLIVGFVLLFVFCWSLYRVFGRPMRYEFPEGFKGWLTIRFSDPTCPPLDSQGAFLIVSVPASGQVCTSTPHSDRWVYYRFEYLHSDGSRTSIPLRSGSTSPQKVYVWLVTFDPDQKWEVDWVGTKEESSHWGTLPSPWRQKSNSENSQP